jgi:hypothetical protein
MGEQIMDKNVIGAVGRVRAGSVSEANAKSLAAADMEPARSRAMTDEIAALTARIASMQAEIYVLREANAYPALVRRQARVEERERCAKMLEADAEYWTIVLATRLRYHARRIRALGDE